MAAPRCRFCACILNSPVTRERGYCRFHLCANRAAREVG